MNRFFRSALFPLIILVVLAWVAMNTLMRDDQKVEKKTTSQVIDTINREPGTIESAVFDPRKQELKLTLRDAQKTQITVHYASQDAQLQIQDLLQEQGVTWDSKGTGSSP